MYRQKKFAALLFLALLSFPPLFAQIDYKHPVLVVKNGLDSKISEVYLSDADLSGWGRNMLPKPIIAGLSHIFTLQRSLKEARIYDISVKTEKGETYSKYGVDLMAMTLVEMIPTDKEIPPPPPVPTTASSAPSASSSSSSNANRTIPDEDALRAQIIAAARRYLGVPYKLGSPALPIDPSPPARGPSRVDCSGFIVQAYKDVTGVTIPRTSRVMFEQGRSVSASELKPGDIIIMDSDSRDWNNGVNHVALYVGPDLALQALSEGPRTGVVETKVPGLRFGKILGYRTFIGATTGNKQSYSPTAVTDYSFELTMSPSSAAEPLEQQTNSMLRFAFHNQTGIAPPFMYRFSNAVTNGTEGADGVTESFTIKQNESFQSVLCLTKTPGTYRLQVYTGSLLLLERTWKVTN
jgi:cell wall-associated NlpC family hydrolase